VQAHALAEFGEANAVAIPGDFLENAEGALNRLDATALTIVEIVIEDPGGRRFGPPGSLAK
jgi:hypothetical protein